MDTSITLNKAKSELRIGRERPLKLLKDFRIEVIQRIKFLLQFFQKKTGPSDSEKNQWVALAWAYI